MIMVFVFGVSILPFTAMDYLLNIKNVWDYFVPFFVIIGWSLAYTKKQHCIDIAKKIVAEFPDKLNELQAELLVAGAGVFIGGRSIETCRQISFFILSSFVFLILEVLYTGISGNYSLAIVSTGLLITLFLTGLHRYFATGFEEQDQERALKQFYTKYPNNILYSPYDHAGIKKAVQDKRRIAYLSAYHKNQEICEKAWLGGKYKELL